MDSSRKKLLAAHVHWNAFALASSCGFVWRRHGSRRLPHHPIREGFLDLGGRPHYGHDSCTLIVGSHGGVSRGPTPPLTRMPITPATVSPPTRSTVRPGAAWRARIDCTLDSGISTYPPSTNPERVSVMTRGDWSRSVLLSVLVTQTVL